MVPDLLTTSNNYTYCKCQNMENKTSIISGRSSKSRLFFLVVFNKGDWQEEKFRRHFEIGLRDETKQVIGIFPYRTKCNSINKMKRHQ